MNQNLVDHLESVVDLFGLHPIPKHNNHTKYYQKDVGFLNRFFVKKPQRLDKLTFDDEL